MRSIPDGPATARIARGLRIALISILVAFFVPAAQVAAADTAPEPAPPLVAVTRPTPLNVDVTTLVPPTVELAAPMVCGDLTVYDQEDVGALCSPTTLAATPITSPTCPQVVSGSVRLETDLLCADTSGLIVGADDTVIDLNGHRILCQGAGYFASCRGGFDDFGVDTNDHDNFHIFSRLPGGTIENFDDGVLVLPASDNVKVKQLTITGPAGAPGAARPLTQGIWVLGTDCTGGTVRLGGGTSTGNDISNHTREACRSRVGSAARRGAPPRRPPR
jgi:hypothetical protein